MNTYNINDQNFINSEIYQRFLEDNQGRSSLRVRAYAAGEAIPISGLKVVVSRKIDNDNVIFFEGYTNESGLTEKISLAVPKITDDNLDIPETMEYDVTVTYIPDNISSTYKVKMYEGICVVQNINIVPRMMLEGGM